MDDMMCALKIKFNMGVPRQEEERILIDEIRIVSAVLSQPLAANVGKAINT